MAATTAACYNPSSKFQGGDLFKRRIFIRSSFADTFPASRSIFCGGFVLKRSVSGTDGLWVQNTMHESIRTSAFRDENSDEGVQVLEQEPFIDGSSQFGSKLVLQDVESILNKLSKWLIAACFGALILWRHDAESLWFAAGSVLNALFSVVLKKILNQERPSTLKSDPGMPSSHGQSIFFFVCFAILSSVEWLGLNEFTIAFSALTLAFGSYFSYLRVSQQLHTVSQVAVGAIIGSIDSILWYWLWNDVVQGAFMSSIWVRTIVVLGSALICLGFVIYAIRHWLKDD